jgi:hypothetical protein
MSKQVNEYRIFITLIILYLFTNSYNFFAVFEQIRNPKIL